MIIGLIVAMRKELELLLPLLENSGKPEVINDYEFHTGTIGRHAVVVMQCGIGKVNAAIGTLSLIDNFSPDCVINSGVAGGADPSMHVLDLLVATEVAYHDVWCGPGTEYGAAAGLNKFLLPWQKMVETAQSVLPDDSKYRYGLICSGDKFISKEEEVACIKAEFPEALAVDMESAAIAQVCTLKKVPFGIIRAISDTPGQEDNISQYQNFWTDAPAETFKTLTAILSAL